MFYIFPSWFYVIFMSLIQDIYINLGIISRSIPRTPAKQMTQTRTEIKTWIGHTFVDYGRENKMNRIQWKITVGVKSAQNTPNTFLYVQRRSYGHRTTYTDYESNCTEQIAHATSTLDNQKNTRSNCVFMLYLQTHSNQMESKVFGGRRNCIASQRNKYPHTGIKSKTGKWRAAEEKSIFVCSVLF